MASETEIERMVIRILGEDSSYQKMIDRAVASGQKMERMAMQTSKAEDQLNEAMRQGAAIAKSVESETEKYNRVLTEMSDLYSKGAISLTTFNRVMKQNEQLLPEFAEATRKAALAEREKQDLMIRGAGLTRSLMTDQEHHTERLGELDKMLKAKAISQETYNRAVQQSMSILRGVGNELQSYAGSLMMVGGTLTTVAGITTGSLAAIGYSAVSSAKEFETTMISFEAMLGSQKQAQKTLSDLRQFAAKTPFEMPTLLSATKMLLQFQVPAENIMGILKSIGDVTGGSDPGKVMSMAYAFSQMSSAGRLMGQDLMQMVNAGFNPLTEISKKTGKSLTDLREEMGQGKITADMVKEAFASASGRLNLMEKQSASLAGRQSTLNDEFKNMLMVIGQQLTPVVGYFTDLQARMIVNFNSLSPTIKTAIAYGGLAVAAVGSLVTASGGLLLVTGGLISSYAALTTAIRTKTAAQAAEAAAVAGLTTQTAGLTTASLAYNAGALVGRGILVANTAALILFQDGVVAATASLVKFAAAKALAMTPTLVGAAAVAGLYRLYSALQDVNTQLSKGLTLAEKLNQIKSSRVDKAVETGSVIENVGERRTFFTREIESAKQEASKAQAELNKARAKVKELDTFWNSGPMESMEDAGLQEARANLREMEKNADAAEAAVKKLQAAMERFKTSPEFDKAKKELEEQLLSAGKTPLQAKLDQFKRQGVNQPAIAKFERDSKKLENTQKQADLTKSIDDTIKKLDEERQLWGLVGDAATIAKFEMEAAEVVGANPQAARVMSEKLAVLRAALKEQGVAQLARDVDEYAKSLKTANDQLGKTNQELEIQKLKLRGATEEQLKLVRAEMERGKQLNVAKEGDDMIKKLQEQIATFGMSSEAVLAYQLRLKGMSEEQIAVVVGLQKQASLMEKARQIVESQKTPEQKKLEQKLELDTMLEKGLLTTNEYTKAMAELGGQASRTAKEINKAMGVDVAEAGSAEALARINAALEGQTKKFGGLPIKNVPPALLSDLPLNVANKIGPKKMSQEMELAANGMLPKRLQRNVEGTEGQLAANDLLPDRLKLPVVAPIPRLSGRNPIADKAAKDLVKASDSMLPARLQSRMGDRAEFAFSQKPLFESDREGPVVLRRDPLLNEEKMVVKNNEEKNVAQVAEGVMLLVELTRQLLGKEPVLFEEANLQ